MIIVPVFIKMLWESNVWTKPALEFISTHCLFFFTLEKCISACDQFLYEKESCVEKMPSDRNAQRIQTFSEVEFMVYFFHRVSFINLRGVFCQMVRVQKLQCDFMMFCSIVHCAWFMFYFCCPCVLQCFLKGTY